MSDRHRSRALSLLTAAVAIPLVALAGAGCGGDDEQATAAAGPPKTTDGGSATIGVANAGSLGRIVVDSQGRTVYLFAKDTGPASTCSGDCAVEWPPVTTKGKPRVGSGVSANKVGTTSRSDGKTQVTYNGHPLYLFEGDSGAGDTNGQGITAFGARWYVLSQAGNQVTAGASSSGSNRAY
jgi:predicted lipoprotein with Yx(FWY)xxD motif